MLLVKTGTVQCISMRDVSAVLSTEAISALTAASRVAPPPARDRA
jgi:hypothetical protein